MTAFALVKYGFAAFAATGTIAVGCHWMLAGRLHRFAVWTLAVIAFGAFCFVDAYVIEPNWLEVTHVKIKDRALAGVLEDTRIVHITDLHLTDGIGYRESGLIRKVNKLRADLIFITGDIVDDLTQLEPARTIIGKLNARIGIYGIPGDTDHIVMDARSFARELAPSGIDILINEHRAVRLRNGKTLTLVGYDDYGSRRGKLSQALSGTAENVPTVLLAPAPAVFDEAAKAEINLALVGDTHGGQVGIPFLIRLSKYANRTPYMKGLFKKKATQMYVNRGIGTKTLPIRFLCRPEIALIEVTR